MKTLKEKMTDYTRYSMILLAVSVFLYIGVAFQHAGKEPYQIFSMMGVTVVFLTLSFTFIFKARKIKKQLQEQDDKDLSK